MAPSRPTHDANLKLWLFRLDLDHAAVVVQQRPATMMEHRISEHGVTPWRTKQNETVGQQLVALHPQMVITAQPEQSGQREHVADVASPSLPRGSRWCTSTPEPSQRTQRCQSITSLVYAGNAIIPGR